MKIQINFCIYIQYFSPCGRNTKHYIILRTKWYLSIRRRVHSIKIQKQNSMFIVVTRNPQLLVFRGSRLRYAVDLLLRAPPPRANVCRAFMEAALSYCVSARPWWVLQRYKEQWTLLYCIEYILGQLRIFIPNFDHFDVYTTC